MTEFYIEYNPYLVKSIFKRNGIQLKQRSRLGAKSSERLQVLLSKSINWEGLAEEIVRSCNDTEIILTFKGRKIDFDDLDYCIRQYEGNATFQLKFNETKNDNDIIQGLDMIFDEIKKKNIPEFMKKDEKGKTIFDAYEEVKNGIFEVNVIATMSSGKSTLINSLLNTELLPSKETACTATITRILDNDDMTDYETECYDASGNNVVYPKAAANLELLKKYNEDENVTFITIEGNIPAIPSDRIRLCLQDTPGPNSARNKTHRALTRSIIKQSNAVILYVMNATQIATEDDKQLLLDISSEMKRAGKQSRDRFIFVINKCDEVDEEKLTIEDLLAEVASYLEEFNIVEPILIPTSALLALLIRKRIHGEEMSRKERERLGTVEDFVKYPLLHFEKYATLTPTVYETLGKKIKEFHENEDTWDLEALIHTGVPALEETIKEYIEKYAYPMKIKDAVSDIKRILDEIDMKSKFERSIVEDNETLVRVREQIQDAIRKYDDSKDIYEDYKKKLQNLKLSALEFDVKEKKKMIEKELLKIGKTYVDKKMVDRGEADRIISKLQSNLYKYHEECESTLNREIEEKIYCRCKDMLEQYTKIVESILDDIKIEGYDFQQISSFDKIKISNVENIIQKNEKDRYIPITKEKKNPEREGFWGFFKFWEPRKISYEKYVKDGMDVEIPNVIVDILTEFSKDMKKNIDNVYQQAGEQISDYKKYFMQNINRLYTEINEILQELEVDTAKVAVIKKRVDENKILADWVADKERQIEFLVAF